MGPFMTFETVKTTVYNDEVYLNKTDLLRVITLFEKSMSISGVDQTTLKIIQSTILTIREMIEQMNGN
jgi:hypothetical protein